MGVPEGSFAVAAFIVFALPGFIFSGVRRWLRGESVEDRDIGLTIARGAVFAVTLTAIYLVFFGSQLSEGLSSKAGSDTLSIRDPSRIGLTVLLLYVVLPFAISFLFQIRHTSWSALTWPKKTPGWIRWLLGWVRTPHSKVGYSAVPNAWNHAIDTNPNGVWIKVKRSNGDWVGGWYTSQSFATTYPEPRSLYIAEQYEITDTGDIDFDRPVVGTGVFLMIGDDDLVIWGRPLTQTPTQGEGSDD